ncbi:MAG: Gldg family protein [Clostridia bacterium]|nr:Gldg family protein [Clostridia bacterium]
MEKKNSLLKDRRFKYGSLAVGLTVAFVALVIILNVVVYALAYSYGWFIDLTGTQYYGITEASERYLNMVLNDGVKIKIVFCQEKDRVLEDSAGYYIYRCVETFRKAYPNNISVEYLDVIKYPQLANIYTTQLGHSLYTYNIIIESNQSTSFRLLTYENFYTFDQESGSIYAFNGEMRFTSTIVGLCTDMPICYFTTGHGEYVGNEDSGYSALYDMMLDAGFDVRTVDLSTADISEEAKVVVVNNPIYDFSAAEVEKLAYFTGNCQGNIMLFLSPEHQDNLDELKEWMSEWGIGIENGQIKDTSNCLDTEGVHVVSSYPTEDTFGPSLHEDLRTLESVPKTVINNPIAITHIWGESMRDNRDVDEVLLSYPSSVYCELDKPDTRGVYNLMSVVKQSRYDNITQDRINNYMLVTSAGYAEDQYINSNAYGNRDILFAYVRQLGKTIVPMDIEFKVFASEELDITTAEAYTWTVVLTAVIPVCVLAVGTAVYVRRKRM